MKKLAGGLIVSCQALPSEPLHSSYIMAKMATAVVEGGACCIRANSVEDITEIKKLVDVSIIGIIKREYGDCPVFITPTLREVEELIKVGVDIIAIDGTKRTRPNGISLEELIYTIKNKYPNQKLMADISTVDEAITCEKLGFDFIGTTLVGYTEYTKNHKPLEVLKEVIKNVDTKVIAEGNINTPALVSEAYKLGAYSVVVGSMITRPQLITKKFVEAIPNVNIENNRYYFSIDIGGTAVKYGLVSEAGKVLWSKQIKTSNYNDINDLIGVLFELIEDEKERISGIGISCTGKINKDTGEIIGGVEIMKNWLNTPLKAIFEEKFKVPVYVDNDVKCIGLNELWLGVGKNVNNFICIAIGTGIGGVVVDDCKIVRGKNNFAGEIGHTILEFNGKPCGCGKNGCFEQYGSMSALLSEVNKITGEVLDGKEIFEKVKISEKTYISITEKWINYIARGVANTVLLLNPEIIVIGGAVSVQKELFLDKLEVEVKKYLTKEHSENIKLVPATNFNNAGMLGAVYGVINNL